MIKRITSILFVTALLFNVFGYFALFSIEKNRIQKEVKTYIKEGIPKNKLKAFVFTPTEFENLQWTKPGKEFRLNGEMYDIIQIELNGENKIYWCYHDMAESKLFANLDSILQMQMTGIPNGIDETPSISSIWIKVYTFHIFDSSISELNIKQVLNPILLHHFSSAFIQKMKKPPRL